MPGMTTAPESEPWVVTGFEDFYLQEFPSLIAVATALAGRDGEDMVQDTMLRTWMRWDRLQRLEKPGGWCHRVLVNRCRSAWRRRVVEASYLARLRRREPASAGPGEDVVAFWRAVHQLPERPRLAVALYYAGDLPVAEVAAVLGVPEGTVRSDLTRAREALRPMLEA